MPSAMVELPSPIKGLVSAGAPGGRCVQSAASFHWLPAHRNLRACSHDEDATPIRLSRSEIMFFWHYYRRPKHAPRLPSGERVYAIGDIHGEAGLLEKLLISIRNDAAERGSAHTTLVILGDFIDRGPDGANLLRTLAKGVGSNIIVLKGNHEDALVAAYRGDEQALRFWLRFGGLATLNGEAANYSNQDGPDTDEIMSALHSLIDPSSIAWLESLPLSWSLGDYEFTHAGVRPGIPLHKQRGRDRLWIRDPFISSHRYHGKIIIHGHTIEPGIPTLGANRIGIDTGAFETGCLTALGLENDQQWLLQTNDKRNLDLPVACDI